MFLSFHSMSTQKETKLKMTSELAKKDILTSCNVHMDRIKLLYKQENKNSIHAKFISSDKKYK